MAEMPRKLKKRRVIYKKGRTVLDNIRVKYMDEDWHRSTPRKITVKALGIAKIVIVRTKANGGL